MSNTLNIAMLQMDLIWEDKDKNLSKAQAFFEQLPQSTDLWVLPEMFTSGFSNAVESMGETMKGKTIEQFKRWAREKDLAIACSLIIKEHTSYFNRFVFIKPDGTVDSYDKAHLFPFGEEDHHYSSGTKRKLIEYKGWRILPQVCYDLRFPVWSRNNLSYDLSIYVASWPAARDHVWRTLLMARAIENMCYTIGVNRVGHDGNHIDYNGQSLVSDAKGSLLTELSDTESQIYCHIDLDKLHAFRDKFPVLHDRDEFEIMTKP